MSVETFAAKWGLKILGGVILVAVAVMLYFLWQGSRDKAAKTQATAEQGVRTDAAASGIAQDAGVAKTEAVQVDIAVTDSRQDYQRGYEDAKRNDPAVGEFGSRPIPQRLRDLARARREARERSGRPGPGSPSDAGTPGTGRDGQTR